MIIGAIAGFLVALVDNEDDMFVTLSMIGAPVLFSLMYKFNAYGEDFWVTALIWVTFLSAASFVGWGLGLLAVKYLGRKSR